MELPMDAMRLIYVVSGLSIIFVYLYDDVFSQEVKTSNRDMLWAGLVALTPVVNTLLVLSVLKQFYKQKTE
jgi:hypothetical protein